MEGAASSNSAGTAQPMPSGNGALDPTASASVQSTAATASAVNNAEPALAEPRTDPLQHNIAEAWERLNQWRAQLRSDAAAITQQQTTLSARESQLEARDAALRGQLHDITRFNEQLSERENELARFAAEVQERADAFGAVQKDFLDRQAEVQRKEEELHRREQAMNQRWSRIQSNTCPHCRKPISLGGS
jgi:DNA repair exonuclease SbcCD ATPase subunit